MGNNLQHAGVFLVNIIFMLYALALMLRFLLQLVRADFYNPISQALVKITNPVLKPLRRIIHGYKGADIAALILVFVVEALRYIIIVGAMSGQPLAAVPVLVFSVREMVILVLRIYFWSVLIEALLSWVQQPGQHNPVAGILWSLNEPIMRRVRRVMPNLEGIDLSPLVVLVVLEVILITLTGSVFGF